MQGELTIIEYPKFKFDGEEYYFSSEMVSKNLCQFYGLKTFVNVELESSIFSGLTGKKVITLNDNKVIESMVNYNANNPRIKKLICKNN